MPSASSRPLRRATLAKKEISPANFSQADSIAFRSYD
jgi:hypothetical protein